MPERFLRHVEPEPNSGCWLWTASCGTQGYGQAFNGRSKREVRRISHAHRMAWEFTNGPIPAGLCVLHRCDVRPCVNPDHLFLGTNADNLRDMRQKGREARGESHGMAKLTAEQVRELREIVPTLPRSDGGMRARRGSMRAIAQRYGVRTSHIREIVSGERWSHV